MFLPAGDKININACHLNVAPVDGPRDKEKLGKGASGKLSRHLVRDKDKRPEDLRHSVPGGDRT